MPGNAFVLDFWDYADDKVDDGDWAGAFDVHKVIKDKCACRILGDFKDEDGKLDGSYIFVMVERDDRWLIAEVYCRAARGNGEILKFDFTSGGGKFKMLSEIEAVVAQRYFDEWYK